MSKSDVLKTIKDEDVDYVDIRFTDPRGKTAARDRHVRSGRRGFPRRRLHVRRLSIAGWKSIDQSDMKLMPDTDSAYLDPFYAEKTSACTARLSSRTPAKPMSATRAAPPKRPRPT